MQVALKEWAVVVEALARGQQAFLLRKGGIAESRRGFELKHREFLFFPTWEHQHRDLVRPEYRDLFASLRPLDPRVLPIEYYGRVTDIFEAPTSLEDFRHFADLHIWAQPYIRTRYEYRPELPLFLVAIKIFRLASPVRLPYDRNYRGCRSWVDLASDVPAATVQPTLPEGEFEAQRNRLGKACQRVGMQAKTIV